MTSNLKHSLRSLRLGLAIIFTLFMAVASWAADVTYTYTCVKAKSGESYYIQSSNGDVQVALGGTKGNQWRKDKAISFTDDDISITPNQELNADYGVLNLPAYPTTTQFTVSSSKWYIKKVTINCEQDVSKTVTNHEAKNSLIAYFSWNSAVKAKLVSIVVELTDEPYYTVKPADGLQIANTDDACLVRSDINGNPLYYFHPDDNITIAPTSAVQVITAVSTPTTGATIASDKRSFSFAMPQSNITPSATLEEAHSVALTGNVSISEPLFTDGDTRYYKPGEKITITAKTDEIIDGITGIENYTIAADQKSATFTMPTSDLTLAVATSEVHTMSVPSGMTLSDPYITIGDVKYYKKGETYTLTAPQYNIIDGFTATGAQSSSVSSDKRSATVTIGSANVTATATLFEVHTMNIAGGMTLSPPFITIAGVKYYRKGGTYTFTAPTYNIIESFTATGALSSTISADKRTAKVTVGTANVTTTASLTEVHTLSVPDGMTLSAPYTTIDNVKYYKRGETYTFTAPENNIIEGFTATGAQSSSVSDDKRSATVTIGQSDVDPIAELTEVHTVTAQDGISLSDAHINILGTDYYKYGQEVTFGFSGSGSVVYFVNGERIEGNSVTLGHENLTVQMGVPYIDENGKEQLRKPGEYTVLTNETDISYEVPGGWYVVLGEVNYTKKIYFADNDVHLILADGAKLNIECNGDYDKGIIAIKNLTIYGQSDHSGSITVKATGKKSTGILSDKSITIVGVKVDAQGLQYGIAGKGVTITGGTVMAKGSDNNTSYGILAGSDVVINGGVVTAEGANYGIFSSTCTFSWTSPSDRITASSYNFGTTIADGKNFIDEDGNVYSGTLNSDQLSAIKGKTLTPCYVVAFDLQDGSAPVMLPANFDGNGVAHVAKPDDPTRSGLNFLGWFTTKDGNTEFDFTAAITGNTTAYARWSVNYVDENGKVQVRMPSEYTVLTNDIQPNEEGVISLDGGWYVVLGEVSYTSNISFSKDTYLILADGAKMTVEVESDKAIYSQYNFTIYGQSEQKGVLKTFSKKGSGINCSKYLTINGGNVTATGGDNLGVGIFADNLTINGGNVTVLDSYYGIMGSSTINGGNVSALDCHFGFQSFDFTINGGTVDVTVAHELGGDGINSRQVTINGGCITVTAKYGNGIYSRGDVLITGGTVTATSEINSGIFSYRDVTISGGTVVAAGTDPTYSKGVSASENLTITGGNVTASCIKGVGMSSKVVTITGGNVTSTCEDGEGIYSSGDIFLSWTNPTDYIKASNYIRNVIIADGKSFTDEDGNVYSGTLNDEQRSAIKDKILAPAPLKYIDENGNEKSVYEYTVLTAEMAANELPGGWYVLENSDPNYTDLYLTNTLWFNGNVNLILADGADMGVVVEKGDAINVAGKLTVYGQSNQTGTLYASGRENGINAENGIVVNGGCVKAYGGDYKYGFNGGENGVDIHLKHYNSYILGSSYREPVTVSGLALHGQDNNGIYEGDLDKAQIENMAYQYQQLEPCYVVKFDKDNNTDPEFLAATFNKEGVALVAKPEVPTREGYTFLEWVDKPQAESTSGVIRKRFRFDEPVKQNTYVYAKWWKNDPVQYVAYDPDEDKVVTKTVEDYTVLTPWTDVSKGLPAEWYIVVNSNEDEEDDEEVDLRFTKQLDFNSETTHIILMDDAQMVVGDDMNSAIHANVLNIYGQSIGSGKLIVNSDSWAIEAGSFNIYGGIVHAFGKLVGIYSYNTAHLYGGYVYVANGNYGIYVNKGDLILDWTRKDDGYNINGYAVFNGGSVIVADGKYFKDEKGHIYVGMLSSNQVEAISQQVIKPLPWKNVGDYSAVQIFEDGNGKKHAVIDGDYELGELVKIPEPVAVDAIEFVRDFDANTPSTVLLPFSLPSCATVNAKFYTLDNVSQSGNKWVATVASIGNALPEANTAYAVMLPTDGRLEFNFDGCSTAEKKQAIFQTGKIETSGNADGSWYFTGTYEFIQWSNPNYIEAVGDGLIYGFAGSNEKGIAKGQFGRVDYSAEINPLRCYLRKKSSDVKLQSLAKSASPVLKAAPYSISLLPETIDVKFVDKDENGERTTAIGRMDPRTGKIRLLHTDRTYDLKGRRVNDVNRAAKGAYYGKKL